VQLSRAGEFYPGTSERVLLLSGPLHSVLTAVFLMLEKLPEGGGAGGGGGGGTGGPGGVGSGAAAAAAAVAGLGAPPPAGAAGGSGGAGGAAAGGGNEPGSSSTGAPAAAEEDLVLGDGASGVASQGLPSTPAPGEDVVKLAVSRKLCGAVLGQRGQTVRDFMADSGAVIRVQPLSELTPSDGERLVAVSGPRGRVLRAVALILNTLSADDKFVAYMELTLQLAATQGLVPAPRAHAAGRSPLASARAHLVVALPDEDVGAILGKRGQALAQVQASARVVVKISDRRRMDPVTLEREVAISGPFAAVQLACAMLGEKLAQARAAAAMGGLGGGGGGMGGGGGGMGGLGGGLGGLGGGLGSGGGSGGGGMMMSPSPGLAADLGAGGGGGAGGGAHHPFAGLMPPPFGGPGAGAGLGGPPQPPHHPHAHAHPGGGDAAAAAGLAAALAGGGGGLGLLGGADPPQQHHPH
jgi:predicted RNA-binding protein YlqC (UPF0109 family)